MDDELDMVPVEWSGADAAMDHAAGLSPFSIERILPKDKRRFLQLREPFMILCENQPVRAAILECARFEMERRLKFTPGGSETDPDWRDAQHRLLLGPDPEKADLWGPFLTKQIVERLGGLSTNKDSIGRAIKWLTKNNWIFVGTTDKPRNGRIVLLNVKQIERDLQDHPFYAEVDFRPSVKGHPDRFMIEPMTDNFTPIYEGLSELVVSASGETSPSLETARAAMLLHRILRRAELREKAGELIPATWTHERMVTEMGWGSDTTWKAALVRLTASSLVTIHGYEARASVVSPNLSRILYLTRGISPVKPTNSQDETFGGNGIDVRRDKDRQVAELADTSSGNAGDIRRDTPALRTESFSESLTEYLSDRKNADESFEAAAILEVHSFTFFKVRRAIQFADMPFEPRWDQLTFDVLAEANEDEAAAAYLLAEELRSGRRSAIAFPARTRKARATIAVLCGYFIDSHVTEKTATDWINVDTHTLEVAKAKFKNRDGSPLTPEEESLKRERARLVERLGAIDNPLIVENVGMAGRNKQLRDLLVQAIRGRRDNLMPVIYFGLPETLAELRDECKDHRLADLVLRTLTERNEPFDAPVVTSAEAEPADPDNPFV